MPMAIRDIDWDVLVEEKDEQEDVALKGREVEDVVTLNVR
jgi:hypothetical protein